MKRTVFTLLAVFVLLTPPARANIVQQLGIAIQSCVVNNNGNGLTNGINVVYYNTHSSAATEVDFLVGYHYHKAVLVDRGSFAHNAQINHNLTDGLTGYPWNGSQPHLCTVQRVVLSNGKVLTP
jgi:hypothetical protein